MASYRTATGLPARPSDGLRERRFDAERNRSVPRAMNRPARGEIDTSLPDERGTSRSGLPSRVPQPTSAPRPSIPQPVQRPYLDHQSNSWSYSSNTTDSGAASVSSHPSSRFHASSLSGSSSSTPSHDSGAKPARNVLRRKKSSIARDATSSRTDSSSTNSTSSLPRSHNTGEQALGIQFDRSLTDSPAEIQVAHVVELHKTTGQFPMLYPELDRYRDFKRPGYFPENQVIEVPYRLATHDLPPPTPASLILSGNSSQVSNFSGSPSTKFSESPGPGAYSRDTTPTSMSSQSPGFMIPRNLSAARGRQISPAQTRPPVTRRRAGSSSNDVDGTSADAQGLAAVRESLTSSSSNSTVRDADKNGKKGKKSTRRLPPPPPSPPPRKSSQKFQRDPSDEESRPKSSRSKKSEPDKSPLKAPLTGQTHPLSPTKSSTPSRPSRDGTPDMQSQLFGPVPVVHSNLSSSSLPGERRGSEPAISGSLPGSLGPSPNLTKNASATQLPTTQEAPKTFKKTTQPVGSRKLTIPEPTRPSRTPSPSTSSSFNGRFLFFGRKKTQDSTATDKAEKKKTGRKGPAAGTGHEGYGKLGAVRRRSGSNPSRGQSSQESLGSTDPFLADRMNPVVIAGGSVIENRNPSSELARSESNQSLSQSRPSTESKVSSEMSSTSIPGSRTTLWPSAIPRGSEGRIRRPSDSSDSDGVTMKSTLAFRRSVQRLRSSPENPLKLPQPINTSGVASSPMTSFDTSVMSEESYIEMQQEVSRGRRNPSHPAPKKLTKRARSPRKWNLFGRSPSQAPSQDKSDAVAATVTSFEKKPVPFYAMMDSEQDDSDVADIQEVLRSADVHVYSPSLLGTPEMQSREFNSPRMSPSPVRASPQPPRPREHAPDKSSQQGGAASVSSILPPSKPGRPSRLAQVGRIPKVVSKRDEHASPKSFSRPFRASMQMAPHESDVAGLATSAAMAKPLETTIPVPGLGMNVSGGEAGHELTSVRTDLQDLPEIGATDKEFLAFSPRKNSDGTVGTSSSSSVAHYLAHATAVVPNPEDPPAEDEVWDEYNDLLGEDGMKPPPSATSSKGTPFHLETYESRLVKDEKPMESPTLALDSRKVSTHSKAPTMSSCYSADLTDMTERIRTAFQPHPSPTIGPPTSAAIEDNWGGSRLEPLKEDESLEQRDRSPVRSNRESGSSSGSDDNSPLAQVNLRVGSMTVSKWLTFGHVLFSDVRHELLPIEGSLKRHSILVIDGLGNDDWSFYAAETYPGATFFNLSPRAPLPAELQSSPTGFPLSPPNHHQIQYVSHLDRFPFAPQSFTSVVYRFPVAAPETHYRNILTEARRVLKPGGYLELSILDVDLNNMGNRGRRTVRMLKERIHEETPDVSLAPTADVVVRLLGKVGFSSIKAARVGVPVASAIARASSKHGKDSANERRKKDRRDQPSLAEMMRDESSVADEGITKMVARVGRWWYTRCYESATGSLPGKSIWNDKVFLAESEELGTSLKLMVCCARAPDRVTSF